jgi:hypothetical protein
MTKKRSLKHFGVAASGFTTGAGGVIMTNPRASPKQIVVCGIMGVLTALGCLRVQPGQRLPANSNPELPQA